MEVINVILPIGSIIELNIMNKDKQDAKFIILKRFVINPNKSNEYFEYEAMLYPGGTTDGKNLLINNEQIAKVVFKGYCDELEDVYLTEIKSLLVQNDLVKTSIV